jgi:hypothetical protein
MATGTGGQAWIWGGPFHPDTHIPAGPAIKDIDGDGEPEIIVLARNKCICLEHDLTEKWVVSELSTPSSDHTAGGAAIADIDGDTYDEIIFSGGHQDPVVGYQGGLFVVSRTGTILSFLALNTAGRVTTLPTIFDIDADGVLEVIVCDNTGTVYCCRWTDGALALVWSRDVSTSPLSASPSLIDINGDGVREILVSTAGGTILALSGVDGSTVASIEHGYSGTVAGTPTAGDIDDDGKVEVLIPLVEAGRLLCFRLGAETTGSWFRRWGFSSGRAGEVSDIDGG